MRWLLSGFGVLVSFGFIIAGAIMNWRYGLGIGRSAEDQKLNAAVHLLIDMCKVMMPFFMWWAWRARRLVVAAGAGLITAAAISYSAIGMAGYVNLSWSMSSGALAGKQDQVADWRAELGRAKDQLSALGVTQASSVIERELEGLRQDARWTMSASCTQATLPASRTYCADYKKREEEKAKAETAAALETQIEALRAKINQLSGVAGIATSARGDPRAEIVARVTGWQLSRVQTVLALLFVGIVECMATFGTFLSLNHGELSRQWNERSEEPVREEKRTAGPPTLSRPALAGHALPKPETAGTVSVMPEAIEMLVCFIAEATEPANGGINIADLYDHYASWCERADTVALESAVFEREFDRLRLMPEVGKRVSKFRSRYIGIGISGVASARPNPRRPNAPA